MSARSVGNLPRRTKYFFRKSVLVNIKLYYSNVVVAQYPRGG